VELRQPENICVYLIYSLLLDSFSVFSRDFDIFNGFREAKKIINGSFNATKLENKKIKPYVDSSNSFSMQYLTLSDKILSSLAEIVGNFPFFIIRNYYFA
jgi:hypothetical protein